MSRRAQAPRLPFLWQRILNVALLSAAWCCAAASLFLQFTTTTYVAVDQRGAGAGIYPLAVFSGTAAVTLLPAMLLCRHVGRRLVFSGAALLGACGGTLELLALLHGTFSLLLAGAALLGVSFATANNFRFAAAEFAPPAQRPRAISAVVLGAVLAALAGPEAARHLADARVPYHSASFMLLIALQLAQALLACCVRYSLLPRLAEIDADAVAVAAISAAVDTAAVPGPGGGPGSDALGKGGPAGSAQEAAGKLAVDVEPGESAPSKLVNAGSPVASGGGGGGGEPCLRELLLSADFIAGSLVCALSFTAMGAMMAASPVEMRNVGISYDTAVVAIEVHIVCMYLPGLVTGDAVRVVGTGAVQASGGVLLLLGTLLFLLPPVQSTFYVGLALLGVGWNLAYVGSSSQAAGVFSRAPSRRLVLQGCLDTVVLALVGGCQAALGPMLRALGFANVVLFYGGLTALLLATVAVHWLHKRFAVHAAPG